MKIFNGYVQIYTGNGKGKTTAALGLCLRAVGAGMKIYIAQFMKKGHYSEIKAINKFSHYITLEQFGTGNFIYNKPSDEDIKKAKEGILSIQNKTKSGEYQLVIMDEGNIAAASGLFPITEIIKIIKYKSKNTELVITGQKAHSKIIELADLVTEMKEIKHYYQKGLKARIGIEK